MNECMHQRCKDVTGKMHEITHSGAYTSLRCYHAHSQCIFLSSLCSVVHVQCKTFIMYKQSVQTDFVGELHCFTGLVCHCSLLGVERPHSPILTAESTGLVQRSRTMRRKCSNPHARQADHTWAHLFLLY